MGGGSQIREELARKTGKGGRPVRAGQVAGLVNRAIKGDVSPVAARRVISASAHQNLSLTQRPAALST